MSPGATIVLALLGAGGLVAAAGWWGRARGVAAPAALVLLAAAGLVAALAPEVDLGGRGGTTLLVVLAGALAVAGGGPVTARVFALVDGADHTGPADRTLGRAGEVLRGGAWIGALERAAIFASLAVAQPEGVAIVLAVKALGRYPELRNQEVTGAAERFIIGTFTSVLWAAACAGLVRLLL